MMNVKRSAETDRVEIEESGKRARLDYTDLITVLVGAAETRFVAHKDILSAKSPFFSAACGRDWIEGQEKIVRLPEQDAEAFRVYLRWVYSDALDMTHMKEPEGTTRPPSYINHFKVWILAHYLQDFTLCNIATDHTIQTYHEPPKLNIAPNTLSYVFEHTALDSPMGQLFLDAYATRISGGWIKRHLRELPNEVVLDMAVRFAEQKPKLEPTLKDRCKYHVHAEGQERCVSEEDSDTVQR
ncbi:hypothetical protein LTR17_009550 [Elasticomyces elasticus]|nr:hypothetical protein LTR17_009550 [Elasticomyces elasticus]